MRQYYSLRNFESTVQFFLKNLSAVHDNGTFSFILQWSKCKIMT